MLFYRLILCVLLIATSSSALAQVSSRTSLSAPKSTSFSLGYEYGNYLYDEPGYMKYSGNFHGVNFAATHRDRFYLRGEGELLFGNPKYEGSSWGGEPVTSSSKQSLLNLKALVGAPISFVRSWIAPVVGLGVRYLEDQMQGADAYRRESRYFYAPIGFVTSFALKRGIKIGASYEYDYFISGVQKSQLSQWDARMPDLEHKQSKGEGQRISFDISGELKRVGFKIQAYHQRWKIENSEKSYLNKEYGEVFEPANRTDQYGLILALEI